MTTPLIPTFIANDINLIAGLEGRVAVLVTEGKLDVLAGRVNRLMRGAIKRLVDSPAWEDVKDGAGYEVSLPAGMVATALLVVRLPKQTNAMLARKAGAAIARFKGKDGLTVLAGNHKRAADIAYGLSLRSYDFVAHRTEEKKLKPNQPVVFMVTNPEAVAADVAPMNALVEGVFFTRDLTNEPANILTTDEFATRLVALQELGVTVEVLDEAELERLGMRTLLAVGQGSESPSQVVVMRWSGGGDEAPFALVGKGVVFDTGGISIKPAQGMEDMTMDMGGAGVVSGVMRALALRKARANVVGVVGLVENMPSGTAQRPGDVVRSMKGDTIEVINTDAEGRLVLADILWYAQERFKPTGMINLATLTGAIIIGLGHENAGVFSNNDGFCDDFLKAAKSEGEGAWRMPMSPAYDKALESRVADMVNSAGRPGGSITAAQFLKRFVKDETPWIHLDIAGVASVSKETDFAPKGSTGWGVRAIDRLIRDKYER